VKNDVNSTFGYDAESRVTNYVHGAVLNHAITRGPRGYKTQEDIYAGLVPNFTNGLRQTRTHNDADQLLTAGTGEYSYDPNGNLTNSSWGTYAWDYDNRLIATPGVQYLYDASGVRVGRVTSPGVTNYFVVDYADGLKRPLAETDVSGTVIRYYVWAGGFRLLAHIDADGAVRYYHSDELGSTLALSDSAGNVTDQFAYAPYGELLSRTGTNSTAFLWLGGYGVYYDSAANLHLTLHRAYSAEQKRFISTDPMGVDGGANLYAYGDLNPLFFVDPMGLFTFQIGFVESAGAGTGQNVSHGIAVSLSIQNGLQVAKYTNYGGGGHLGMSGGGGIEVGVSENRSIDDLSGITLALGGSGGALGKFGGQVGNIPIDGSAAGPRPVFGATFQFGAGGEVHSYVNNTIIHEKIVDASPFTVGSYIFGKMIDLSTSGRPIK
jgi:RHS repeat-associated protein